MGFLEILLIAVGLSMDSFAVSLTSGAIMPDFRLRKVLKMAVFLAVFQAVMPLIGWLLGINFKQYIENFDHWVAFLVLLVLGGKMIFEAMQVKDEKSNCQCFDPSGTGTLVGLSIATSIDALAVGISFAFLSMDVCVPTLIIGLTTFVCSFAALYIGHYFGRKLQKGAEILGGVILILIGLKILIGHLCFNS